MNDYYQHYDPYSYYDGYDDYDNYDDYDDYDGYDEYGESYDDSYWGGEEDYWDDYDDESGYYHGHYGNQQYIHHHDATYEQSYPGHSYNHYDQSYSHQYATGHGHQYTNGGMHHGYNLQHQADGSHAWSIAHTPGSYASGHYAPRSNFPSPRGLPAIPLTPVPPTLPDSLAAPMPSTPPVLPAPRPITPGMPSTSSQSNSRALNINRDQHLSIWPINPPLSQANQSPTPTESFFHNLFWKSPVQAQGRTAPTTPMGPMNSRQRLQSPNLMSQRLTAPSSAVGNSPGIEYDMKNGTNIGFLAPPPPQS